MYSSINISQSMNPDQATSYLPIYEKMLQEYVKNGFTYKSNEILHKISQKSQEHPRPFPYDLLLQVTKIYHLNQFEIIFFTHILNKTAPSYEGDSQNIFGIQNIKFPTQIQKTINEIHEQSLDNQGGMRGFAEQLLGTEENIHNEEKMSEDVQNFTIEQLKKIYLYLLVIGYAIKYYLNQPVKAKPYEEYVNRHIQNFIPTVFNKWARKHGNSVLSTTPRMINAYYMSLGFLQGEEENNEEKQAQDCQYRNYNEIVEELIKATTQIDDQTGQLAGEDNFQQD